MTVLHVIGGALRNAFAAIPLSVAKGLFVGLLAAILVWVLTLPAEATQPPEGARRWSEDLRVWAAAALLIQMAIYLWV